MTKSRAIWHENDAFWETFEAALFTSEHLAEAEDDVMALLELTGLAPPARVLDLCCGPGRHSLALARRGFSVTGFDRTQAFLDRAAARAAEEALEVTWQKGDMRTLACAGAFELCINLYTSFGYFADEADDRRVLENIHRALVPGGSFVIELIGKEILARVFEPQEWNRLDDGSIVLQEREVTAAWERMSNTWTLIKDGTVHEQRLEHRLFSARELRELLQHCGFSTVAIYGDLEGLAYDHEARRLVAVAQKPL